MLKTDRNCLHRSQHWLLFSLLIWFICLLFLFQPASLFAIQAPFHSSQSYSKLAASQSLQQAIVPDLQEHILEAPNLHTSLRVAFDTDGTTTVRQYNRPWGLYMQLENYGRTSQLTSVTAPTISHQNQTVNYQWNSVLTEQLQLDGTTLNQNVVLASSPAGVGLLSFNLFVDSSFTPSIDQGNVLFRDTQNTAVLRYRSITIRDAANATFVPTLALASKQITIMLNDASALYPLRLEMELSLLDQSNATANSQDWFGQTLAADADTLVVGAPGEDSNGLLSFNGTMSESGAAYTYRRGANGWELSDILKQAYPGLGDAFGSAVAISGDTIVVGAPFRDGASPQGALSDMGAAYVFERSGESWNQVAELVLSDARSDDLFGSAVAIDGDTIAVGAYQRYYIDPSGGGAANAGAVYIYQRNGASWQLQSVLTAPEPEMLDQFGWAMALDGNRVAVSANRRDVIVNSSRVTDAGAVFLFQRSGTSWSLESQLQASDPEENAHFGRSLAMDGEQLLVGAPFKDRINSPAANRVNVGAAYLFERSGASWSQQAILSTAESKRDDRIGWSVALRSGTALLASPYAMRNHPTTNALISQGSAYLFAKQGAEWQEQDALHGPAEYSLYGIAGALLSDTIFVGASRASNSNFQAGRVYAYQANARMRVERAGTPVANTGLGYDFGLLGAGQSTSQSFTIFNDSTATLKIGDLSLFGPDASAFSLDVSGLQTSIAPNTSSSFTVKVVSQGSQTQSAFVSFTSNDLANLGFSFEVRAGEQATQTPTVSPSVTSPTVTVTQEPSATSPTSGTVTQVPSTTSPTSGTATQEPGATSPTSGTATQEPSETSPTSGTATQEPGATSPTSGTVTQEPSETAGTETPEPSETPGTATPEPAQDQKVYLPIVVN